MQQPDIPFTGPSPEVASPPGGGGNGARLRDIENRLTKIETKMDYVATREDLEKLKNSLLRYMVMALLATVGVTSALVIGLARFV